MRCWHEFCSVRGMDIKKEAKDPTRRRRSLAIALSIVALLVTALFLAFLGKAAPSIDSADVWIDSVVQGDMKREIRASGRLVPKEIRWVTASATATVKRVVVQGGKEVAASDTILELENAEVIANLVKAKAAYVAAEADAAALRASLASQLMDQRSAEIQSESEWMAATVKADAHRKAFAAGILSSVELKQTEIAEQQAERKSAIEKQRVSAFQQNMEAQLRAAVARNEEVKSSLDIASQQVSFLTVTAGINGTLQHIEVEEGQQVESGVKLARVARPDELIARLLVPEMLATGVIQGLSAEVDARNGSVIGRIARVDPAVRDGAVTVDVELPAKLPSGARPDLSVEGRILLGTLADVASIGRPALAAADSTGRLLVLDSSGTRAHWASVEYGAASSDRIEVRSGLKPGQKVILSDSTRWADYEEVRIK
ncbi:ABC transporter permease [Xanthomonas arboricola pv. fragariae]|nr:hypothetical protein XarCFBP6762_05710 [Xanthomonas arboricola]SOT99532.1 ABC transporter permease [Xanthomonas arboricola pv. fragariae]